MKTSESIKEIAPALLKAQMAIGAAVKGATNPFFKSNYADLGSVIEAVKGPLNDAGISFLQGVGVDDGPQVHTMLLHTSGEWIATATPIYCAKQNDPQSFGSGLTYSKRYALQALLGLPATDDDGERAMPRNQPKTKPEPTAAEMGDQLADMVEGKPPVPMDSLRESGDWIKTHKTAKEALAELAKKYTITNEADAFVKECFE